MAKHYGQKVVILIDEYDVPLAKAYAQGYYDEMLSLIRSLFHQALKTSNSLQFAVLTGCMRISKESIFTGLNNLNVLTITNVDFDESFGFTDSAGKRRRPRVSPGHPEPGGAGNFHQTDHGAVQGRRKTGWENAG